MWYTNQEGLLGRSRTCFGKRGPHTQDKAANGEEASKVSLRLGIVKSILFHKQVSRLLGRSLIAEAFTYIAPEEKFLRELT